MKKKNSSRSGFTYARLLAALVLCSVGLVLTLLSLATPAPTSDTLNTTTKTTVTYVDTTGPVAANPSAVATGTPVCASPVNDTDCSTFLLTIDPSVGAVNGTYNPADYQISIKWQWSVSAVDYDWFVEDSTGTVIARNQSTADPSGVILPATTAAGTYKLIGVLSTGAPVGYTGTITLEKKPSATVGCVGADCTPPRYMNFPAGSGQADNAGEPSLGVDWNPNVAALKNGPNPTTPGTPPTNHINLNTGGVSFYTSGSNEWRVNFDDCASPANYIWEDVSAVFTQTFVLSDPIGFVDHYSSIELGLTYPEPLTPGRVFSLDLIGGEGQSLASYSDTDGNAYLPGGNGGPGAGPDHETIGGGPYAGTPPANATYPTNAAPGATKNAIYYCSQNIVAEAQCSRSDDGGQTFGPGIPIFTPTQCTGGIHGHVKVARDGTVYVPNSSCATTDGGTGVAVSRDNGLTWIQRNPPLSTSTQDPSAGIGQNDVGKNRPAIGNQTLDSTANTLYFGWVSAGGHAMVSASRDRGITWGPATDVGIALGVTHAVFPSVVAGDDNRAAFAFVGTGDGVGTPAGQTCDPYGAVLNCANIWHLYVATTYDGGTSWVTIDATPLDPVQQGTVCLQGTTCAGGRNLLDFMDFAIDAEGRGLVGWADGCVNCNNTFTGQSGASHGTVTRQSGGRRLFAHFDILEPHVPAAPRLVSAVLLANGQAKISWLEPDNGGSPITSYKIYRGTSSGTETLLATVPASLTDYFDTAPPAGQAFYFVTAVNAPGESPHCDELSLLPGGIGEDVCVPPGITILRDIPDDIGGTLPAGVTPPTSVAGYNLHSLQLAQPFQNDLVPRLVFQLNVDTAPTQTHDPGSAWYVSFHTPDGKVQGVRMVYYSDKNPGSPTFERYEATTNNSGGSDGRFVKAGSQVDVPGSYDNVNGRIIITVKASDLGLSPGSVINGFNSASTQSSSTTFVVSAGGATGTIDEMPNGLGYVNTYTVHDAQFCNTAPVAVLTASPLSGPAPLLVHFDGSASSDPDLGPPADTIVKYHFDFGDGASADCPGNAACTGTGKVDHTYTTDGEFPARLTVTDSRGKDSSNIAQVIITVTTSGPPLTGIVSRKTHGNGTNAATFDVVLPITGPPGIECRRIGPAPGSHKVIFGFENPLTSAGQPSAAITTSSGTTPLTPQPTGAIGTDPHQYIVDLSGVPDACYVNITLNNVVDSKSKSGNVLGRMGVLLGDVDSTTQVDGNDVSAVQGKTRQTPDSSNFRMDVNCTGLIDGNDVSLTQGNTRNGLPAAAAAAPSKAPAKVPSAAPAGKKSGRPLMSPAVSRFREQSR